MNYRLFKLLFVFGMLALGASAWASKEKVGKIVPDSKIVSEDKNEFEAITPQNTAIEIEFNKDGTIEEASGNAAQAGDVFIPGENRIPLSDAVDALKKSGKTLTGEWEFDQSMTSGWVYEFDGTEDGKKMEYTVSASDGKILKERRDW